MTLCVTIKTPREKDICSKSEFSNTVHGIIIKHTYFTNDNILFLFSKGYPMWLSKVTNIKMRLHKTN